VTFSVRVSLVLALAGLALAACSSSGPSKPAAPTTTTVATPDSDPAAATATTTATPAACRLGAGYAPGTAVHRITVDGEARELIVHIPPKPEAGMRLVVDFHGAGSDMQQQDLYSGFDRLADKEGFVVATPNGAVVPPRQWRFLDPSDIAFAKAIVSTLAANACVDRTHAYATGISSGGAMTTSLACSASDVFAGFGPVAAEFYNETYCGAAKPRPLIIFHGTADMVVPYAGGTVATGQGLTVRNTEATAAQWAKHNRCSGGPVTTKLGSEVTRLRWTGCAAPVELYRIDGGGHTWPGGVVDVERLGMTTHQVSATDEMWKFFTENS
jgi:polyhydroxybutyrate depolymerase